MEGSDVARLVLLLVALLLSAFFSGSEAAFLSIQRGRLAYLTKNGVKGADKVALIAGHPEKLLPTVLTGNNLVNTAAAVLGTALAMSFLEPNIAIVAATAGVTILLLVFSEIIPKTVAARNAERFAIIVVGPLLLAEALLLPAVWVLRRLSNSVGRLFGASDAAMFAEGEIRALIDTGREDGAVEPSEARLLENVFRFGDRQIREVMTPRTEIISLEKGATLEIFLGVYQDHSHTRFPIFDGTVDNVIGTLSVKDVVRAMTAGDIGPEDDVTDVLREAYFVPETKLVGQLFDELRQSGYQVVMVADEFGGLAGLVTLKQMVEEIVGRVSDEGVQESEEYQAIDSNTFQADAGMHVEEANAQLALGIPEGEYETLAGFLLTRFGHIPREEEYIHHNGFQLQVVEMKGVRIEQVRVTRVARPDAEASQ